MAAASELFAERGFHRTTVRDIAARARVNVAAGHYHYGSKRALYLAVLRAQFADVRATLQARGAAVPEGELRALSRRQLAALLRTRVNVMLDLLIGPPPGLHGTLMHREMCDPSEALPVIVDEFILPMFGEMRAIAARLAPGRAEGARALRLQRGRAGALLPLHDAGHPPPPRRARLPARAGARAGGAHHGVLAGRHGAGGGEEQACAVVGRVPGYPRGESGARPSNALGAGGSRARPWFAPDFALGAPRHPPCAPGRSCATPLGAGGWRSRSARSLWGLGRRRGGRRRWRRSRRRSRSPHAATGASPKPRNGWWVTGAGMGGSGLRERRGARGGVRGASGAKSGANHGSTREAAPPKAFDGRAPDSPRRYPAPRPPTAHACSPPPARSPPARTP